MREGVWGWLLAATAALALFAGHASLDLLEPRAGLAGLFFVIAVAAGAVAAVGAVVQAREQNVLPAFGTAAALMTPALYVLLVSLTAYANGPSPLEAEPLDDAQSWAWILSPAAMFVALPFFVRFFREDRGDVAWGAGLGATFAVCLLVTLTAGFLLATLPHQARVAQEMNEKASPGLSVVALAMVALALVLFRRR